MKTGLSHNGKPMHSIEDIPSIPDQGQRIEEITVDCYNQAEELAGF
jgi:hypothetical protein